MVPLDTTIAVEFLHWMGILGCGQTISIRFWRRGIISLGHMKRPASSTSASEDMANLVVCEIVRTIPLMLVTRKFSDNILCIPA